MTLPTENKMRGDEIDRLLRSCKVYRGTYAADELHYIARHKRPLLAVINTHDRKSPGEHWTVIYLRNYNYGEYFDSYGKKPSIRVQTFLNDNCLKWTYNAQCLQSELSISCGYFCLVYCIFKCSGKRMKDMLKIFSTDTLHNEYILKRFLQI